MTNVKGWTDSPTLNFRIHIDMKVYTRTGDSGTTSLVGGTRIDKDNTRLEAYGTVDELNSWLGLLDSSEAIPQPAHATLLRAMNLLFDIGASLATEEDSKWQPAPSLPPPPKHSKPTSTPSRPRCLATTASYCPADTPTPPAPT